MLAPLMKAFKDAIDEARKAVVAQDKSRALDALTRLDSMLKLLHEQLAQHLGDTLLGVLTRDVLGGLWNLATKAAGGAKPAVCTHDPATHWFQKDNKLHCEECGTEIYKGDGGRWYRK